MKTRDEVEHLKLDWKADPIFDLYKTEGFEEYHEELKVFQTECYKQWMYARWDRVNAKAEALDCSPALAEYILGLEGRLRLLEELSKSK